MAPTKILAALALGLGAVSGFAPAGRPALSKFETKSSQLSSTLYDDAVSDWEKQWPMFAKWGWGPTVQAEVWNGRHAMFGWVFMCATAYAKGHGLIPDADVPLDFNTWGTLATYSGMNTIPTERAVIMVANMHALGVSLMATCAPVLPFGDSLLLDETHPAYERQLERNKNPFGYFPEFKTGLTEEAEILNGRLAMLGIATLVSTSAITGTPMIDVINQWVGGAYY